MTYVFAYCRALEGNSNCHCICGWWVQLQKSIWSLSPLDLRSCLVCRLNPVYPRSLIHYLLRLDLLHVFVSTTTSNLASDKGHEFFCVQETRIRATDSAPRRKWGGKLLNRKMLVRLSLPFTSQLIQILWTPLFPSTKYGLEFVKLHKKAAATGFARFLLV
jgi:hypothetical protein